MSNIGLTAPGPVRILFVCNLNMMRSPTAERLFASVPGLEVKSAGVDPAAATPIRAEIIEWADLIFVMERRQQRIMEHDFPEAAQGKKIVNLRIPDRYGFMDPALIAALLEKVAPHLSSRP